jgi:hypothetical protein
VLEHRHEVAAHLVERARVQEALDDEEPVLAVARDLFPGRLDHG